MVSNSVTHQQSYTNTAIADITGNSTDIARNSVRGRQCHRAKRRYFCIERRHRRIEMASVWLFHDVSQCLIRTNLLYVIRTNLSYIIRTNFLYIKNQRHSWAEILSYSHSCKHNLPVTHSSPLCMWLSTLLFFYPAKTMLLEQGYGFCWWRR